MKNLHWRSSPIECVRITLLSLITRLNGVEALVRNGNLVKLLHWSQLIPQKKRQIKSFVVIHGKTSDFNWSILISARNSVSMTLFCLQKNKRLVGRFGSKTSFLWKSQWINFERLNVGIKHPVSCIALHYYICTFVEDVNSSRWGHFKIVWIVLQFIHFSFTIFSREPHWLIKQTTTYASWPSPMSIIRLEKQTTLVMTVVFLLVEIYIFKLTESDCPLIGRPIRATNMELHFRRWLHLVALAVC